MFSLQYHEFLSLLENVDPSLKETARDVFTPKGTCRVATSKNFVYIVSNILRGFTPCEISQLLERERKEYITDSTIRDYALAHVPPQLTRQNIYHKYFQQMASLDEVAVLDTLLKVQLARVTQKVDKAAINAEDEESIRREIDLTQKIAMNSIEAKIKTGRLREAPKDLNLNINADVRTEQNVTNTVHVLDARSAAKAMKAIERIRTLTAVNNDDPTTH